MTNRQRAQLYHDFSRLIAAGMGLDRSVDLLLEQGRSTMVKRYLIGIKLGLRERLSFAQSIAKHNADIVSPLEITLVEAGERGGRIEKALEHLSSYFELKQKATDKALGAIVYPLILLHMGLLIPDLSAVVRGGDMGPEINAAIWRIAFAWVIIAMLGVAWWMLSTLARRVSPVDRLLRLLPLIGSTRRHWALARFCQVFQTGLLAAMNMSETLRLAGEATQSAVLRSASMSAARKVEKGSALSPAIKSSGDFPPTFNSAVDTAEHTGGLDTEMGRWANTEAEMAARAQDRAAEWLPRIGYALIVMYVGSRIIGMFSGLYGAAGPYAELLNS
jgi:type II secretory pathway component PulF